MLNHPYFINSICGDSSRLPHGPVLAAFCLMERARWCPSDRLSPPPSNAAPRTFDQYSS